MPSGVRGKQRVNQLGLAIDLSKGTRQVDPRVVGLQTTLELKTKRCLACTVASTLSRLPSGKHAEGVWIADVGLRRCEVGVVEHIGEGRFKAKVDIPVNRY